ncbi:phage tail assembly protein [Candidatus Ferrigenium straubiae]|jgi:hypothetical protein|uniref:phage tail assembly protein n=1 Tax=Candidatus Ferrigenium straubiae TaxID=2919506 RepID=UPI003F4AB14B
MAKLKLKHPLTFGKTTVEELTFRDYPIASDYLSFDRRGGVAQRIALIASLTGTDEQVVEHLHGSDYRRAEAMADKMMADDEAEALTDEELFPKPKTPEQEAAEKKSQES